MRASLVAALVASIVGFSTHSVAQAVARRATAIPPQELAPALRTLMKEREFQIVYSSELLVNHRTPGATGDLTMDEALTQILSGTGFTYRYLDDNTITILPSAPLPSSGERKSVAQSANPSLHVRGEGQGVRVAQATGEASKGESKGFFSRLRLAQAENPSPREGRGTQGEASDPSKEGSDTGLTEVIVMARRRQEKAQEVPIAVTVLSQKTLEDNNVFTLTDLQYLVPSMSALASQWNRDSVNISIRGQGQNADGGRPGVVVYINEVPIPTGDHNLLAGGPGLLFDLENVQVLKGPQGTLFGKNSVGGALLLQTARPTDELGGRIQLGAGNYNTREVDAAFNLPIVHEKLLTRFAFNGAQRDGFTRLLGSPSHPDGIDVDDRDFWSARATIAFHPSDRFHNDFIATYQEYDSNGSPQLMTFLDPNGPIPAFLPAFGIDFVSIGEQQVALGSRAAGPFSVDLESRGSNLSLNNITHIELSENLAFRNILGYDDANAVTTNDGDMSFLPLGDGIAFPFDRTDRQVSEEAQLLGKAFGQRLDWIFGAFYLRTYNPEWALLQQVIFFTPTDSESRGVSKSKAVFSQGTYDLSALANGLHATAGVRYTEDSAEGQGRRGPLAGHCCATSGEEESHALTWTLGLDYQATPDTLLYFRSGRGYRPGGSNGVDGNANPLPDFDPEYVTDFELGVKSDWRLADVPVRTNAAVYYQNYTDIQVGVLRFNPQTATFNGFTGNAAKARQWGAELEARAQLFRDLQLGLNFDYMNSKYTQIGSEVEDPAALGTSLKINRPPYKYGVNVRYHVPLAAEAGDLSLQANWSWQDTSGNRTLQIGGLIPSFGLLNLTVNWDGIAGRPIDASLFASNLQDKEYRIGGFGTTQLLGWDSYRFGEPRMYGVRVRYNFGAP